MAAQLVPSDDAVASIACDALVVGAFAADGRVELSSEAKELDDVLEGALNEAMQETGSKASVGETTLVPTMGRTTARTIAVVGLGPRKEAGPNEVRRASGAAVRKLTEKATIACALHRCVDSAEATSAAAEGLLLGSYRFLAYKTKPKPVKIQQIIFPGASQDALERGSITAEATGIARDLTNEPAERLTPTTLARRAEELADVHGLACEVWDEEMLAREGFGGLLGVARGSSEPPRFIQLRYVPDNPKGKVALIGKGITFDSGGLSLKDAKNMEEMKTDMAGAAAVIGAMTALGRLDVNVEVHAFVPSTENMPGPAAIKPGDVIKHYGGRTTEVLNTDAEGRLVLGDAIVYASEQNPDAIVDVATLTGSIVVALGKKVAGLFTNDDALQEELKEAAESSGDRLWPMPLFEPYRSEIESEIADSKNTGSRWGGSISAALFLSNFVGEGIPWAHIDIAGMSRAESDYEETVKGGTGAATRCLIRWAEGRGH